MRIQIMYLMTIWRVARSLPSKMSNLNSRTPLEDLAGLVSSAWMQSPAKNATMSKSTKGSVTTWSIWSKFRVPLLRDLQTCWKSITRLPSILLSSTSLIIHTYQTWTTWPWLRDCWTTRSKMQWLSSLMSTRQTPLWNYSPRSSWHQIKQLNCLAVFLRNSFKYHWLNKRPITMIQWYKISKRMMSM